jgi:hypothetical protein
MPKNKHAQIDVYWKTIKPYEKTTVPFGKYVASYDYFIESCKSKKCSYSQRAIEIFQKSIGFHGDTFELKKELQCKAEGYGIQFATYLRSLIVTWI